MEAPTPSRFNLAVDASRAAVERARPELEQVYDGLIRKAARIAARQFRSATKKAVAVTAASTWQPPPTGNLVPADELTALAVKALAPLHRRIVKTAAGEPLAEAGISFTVVRPLTDAMLAAAGARTGESLGQAVQPLLQEIIAAAYDEGLSVADTADRIVAGIDDVAPFRARMLARTDLNGLANGGSVAAAQVAGVGFKQWLTAEDDRVRPEHAAADGQVVPVDQPFLVGGEQLDFPGDPSGSDAEVCNCRCTVIYLDSAEAVAASGLPSEGSTMTDQSTIRWRAKGGAGLARAIKAQVAALTRQTVEWVSDIAFEGTATSDGRYILPNALGWRDLPLSLGAMFDTPHADVVMASPVVGRIDQLSKTRTDMAGTKLPAGVTAIRAHGEFDMEGDDGANVARMVADETMRGVSIDLAVDEWVFRDPETGTLIDPTEATDADLERSMFGELQFAVVAGTIMAATVCPTPAFADARIALAASSDGKRVIRLWAPLTLAAEALTASAAGLAPAKPPRDWFYLPEAAHPTPLTVTADGQVFGHMALWESCHTGYPGQCVPPPRSPSGYTYFNLGAVECDDGSVVPAGAITLEGLHADTRRPLKADAVRAHYENTAVVAAHVRASDGKHGIWVSGALKPDLSERHARDLMGAKPSGDWRQVRPGGALEMLGVHAVNQPGYPVPRLVASALTPSGGRASLEFGQPPVDLDVKLRVLGARAEGGIDALADLAGV